MIWWLNRDWGARGRDCRQPAEAEEADQPRQLSLYEQLQADLDAIESPTELYLIGEDIQTGLWWVQGWRKHIGNRPGWSPYASLVPAVISGYETLAKNLRSKEQAERWLAAYVDPEGHRTAYDAQGNRITTETNP